MTKPAPLSAYDLFRFGHDTLAIAAILQITEAEAVRRLDAERNERRNKKYIPRYRDPNRIAYAGAE